MAVVTYTPWYEDIYTNTTAANGIEITFPEQCWNVVDIDIEHITKMVSVCPYCGYNKEEEEEE